MGQEADSVAEKVLRMVRERGCEVVVKDGVLTICKAKPDAQITENMVKALKAFRVDMYAHFGVPLPDKEPLPKLRPSPERPCPGRCCRENCQGAPDPREVEKMRVSTGSNAVFVATMMCKEKP